MTLLSPIGILGGTFNPIHEGHIAIAEHVLHTCELDHIEFIPCYQPPHRNQPTATPDQRLAMVKLATQHYPKLMVNDYEIRQQEISYTVNTLTHLRKLHPNQPICFIVGSDAFSHFHEWYQFEKIFELAHIIIVSRTLRENSVCANRMTNKITDLHHQLAGLIYFDNITPIPISATQIRKDIQAGKKNIAQLNPIVEKYIVKNRIYQMKFEELIALVVKQLEDSKALNITQLNTKKLSSTTDMMIVATGTSTRHVQSIAKKLIHAVKEVGVRLLGVEGEEYGEWVLIDLGDVIVHVMLQTQRELYNLEELWSKAQNSHNRIISPTRKS